MVKIKVGKKFLRRRTFEKLKIHIKNTKILIFVTIQFSPGGDKAPLRSILRRVGIIG